MLILSGHENTQNHDFEWPAWYIVIAASLQQYEIPS